MPATALALKDRLDRAESAEEIAEICQLEAEQCDGPYYPVSDTITDIAAAYGMARLDQRELAWLGEAHTRAYNERRTDDCIRILNRIRAIKGPVVPPCPRGLRITRDGRIWRRRAFATGFTTW